MSNLWDEKTGGDEEFNCVNLTLTLEDINALEDAINKMDLPETQGFFYGSDSYDGYEDYYKEIDQKFITDAKKFIEDGKEVYYTCWW